MAHDLVLQKLDNAMLGDFREFISNRKLMFEFSGCVVNETMMATVDSGVWELPANFPSYDSGVQVSVAHILK